MDQVSVYKETSVTTQNKGRLVVMLYDGAIKFMKLAIEKIEVGDVEGKSHCINKAVDIVNELNAVLNTQEGGEIAANLRKLYLFMSNRLAEADVKRDTQRIRDVISLMEELNQGWKAITG
jgi:flagellar protein FliS